MSELHGALEALLDRNRGAAGPHIDVDFDRPGVAWRQLSWLTTQSNGGSLFNSGVQIFRMGDLGVGPDAVSWNSAETWKDTYGGLADDLFCFAQDVLGVQFAIDRSAQVVTFDPESADRVVLGSSLQDWASWLLDDPDVNGAGALATRWQDEFGALDHDERLIARQFFLLGGSFELANLKVEDSVRAMRIRGPVAAQIHDLRMGRRSGWRSSERFPVELDHCCGQRAGGGGAQRPATAGLRRAASVDRG